jgi:hypothetical protein
MHRLLLIFLAASVITTTWFALFPQSTLWPNRPVFLHERYVRWTLALVLLASFGFYFGFALVDPGTHGQYDTFVDPPATTE